MGLRRHGDTRSPIPEHRSSVPGPDGAPSLPVEDALAYLDLLAEQKPRKLERAVVRWHGLA